MFSRSFAGIVSDSYGRRGCKGEESFGGKVWIIGVENKPNHSDESFPDVVVAVGQPIGEVEQVAHPHRDLEYFTLTTVSELRAVAPQPRSLSTTVAEVVTQGW